MQVGDKVKCTILVASLYGAGSPEVVTGTVIYIHPKRRFYRVRFDFTNGSWNESFLCEGGCA